MPPKKPAAKGGKKGGVAPKAAVEAAVEPGADDGYGDHGDGDAEPVGMPVVHDWEPAKQYVKPPDQMVLSEKELNEERTCILRADNPNAPDNIARFSYSTKGYRQDPHVDHLAMHFSMDGRYLNKDSQEAKNQKIQEDAERDSMLKAQKEAAEAGENGQEVDDSRALRNQFNYSERASMTQNNALKDRGTITEPPPSVEYAAQATQWEIFDAYIEDQSRQEQAKQKTKKGHHHDKEKSNTGAQAEKKEEDVIHSAEMTHSVKIMERMVNQNTHDDIAQDFKYWEDASDTFREGEGTLLPLWKFSNEKGKRKHVTCIKWNPEYNDLFAVAYGSYDFIKQTSGMLCLYSLKNTSFPEFSCTTETGVMSLDWHPQHCSLLVVGMYDGVVAVYDVRNHKQSPIFQSTVKTGKHTDPVWEVCWQEEDLAKNLNFFSISSDGRVTLWTLSKNELEYSDVMELKLVAATKESEPDEDTSLCGLAGGCCFDFNKFSEHLFLVGTEEGTIHKCSKAYNSQYLETYEGHNMAVYTVRWNTFHQRVFISCSADWTVKIWDHNIKTPIMSFDLNTQVGDVAWAPYSSTTFAACTTDGKVHVFDLNENKHEAMCDQKVVRKAKLTKLCFNPKDPVLLIGDDHGCISSLKLSPNLRWTAITKAEAEKRAKEEAELAAAGGRQRGAPKKNEDDGPKKDPAQLELEKLEKLLEVAVKAEKTMNAAN